MNETALPGRGERHVYQTATRQGHPWRWLIAFAALVVVLGGAAATLIFTWPHVTWAGDREALASVSLPAWAGTPGVTVRSASGATVPAKLTRGLVWPIGQVAAGQSLAMTVTVHRPGWIGWLVGSTEQRRFTVTTPSVHLTGTWLQVKPGAPVTVASDGPVKTVSLAGKTPVVYPHPVTTVDLGVTASGAHSAGRMTVAVAARSWEKLSAPVRVTWFPASAHVQVVASPRTTTLSPGQTITIIFSTPIRTVLGDGKLTVSPAVAGNWRTVDAHTLAFHPKGLGFGFGAHVRIRMPRTVQLVNGADTRLTRTLAWTVPQGSTLRLQQLLAQLGYLPVKWKADSDPPSDSVQTQLAAAITPPSGTFHWRYHHTPAPLKALWNPSQFDVITKGAVMMFEDEHHMTADAVAGPEVWQALIRDEIAGKRRKTGYNYVFVHETIPQSMNLWHNGRVILRSPGNTGIASAPTEQGTFPVFEHIPVGTMSGTNPDGSKYNDPGVQWISYFNGGDALHAFPRASYGTPQSLGCVELPLTSAAKVWPYTPIGTLVTVED